MLQHYRTVFKDEAKLDINYVPLHLPHRTQELAVLNRFFQYLLSAPIEMSQRVLIIGKIGTGKTALAQNFGMGITKSAEQRSVNLRYVHVNCRECRGNLYTVLQRIIANFIPNFPKRGYSTDELFQALLESLEEKAVHLILTLDELETLIQKEGADPIYKLTRLQESRMKKPHRISLICILREPKILETLDRGTRSTLQGSIRDLEPYKR
ncbi:MAG: AAA family ATPase, partial [Candidatus Jordarchaeaceae archaeon]